MSSIRGPFELSVHDVLAIGQHARFPDGTDPFVPDIDGWIGVLTHAEYGIIHEGQLEYSDFAKQVSNVFGVDAFLGGWAWSGWNESRGCDSRFIYPPWIYGFSVYEWPLEGRSGWRQLASQLTGLYCFKAHEGILGATVDWLVTGHSKGGLQRWRNFLVSPPHISGLGRRRFTHHWRFPYETLQWVVSSSVVMIGAIFWEDLSRSLTGWLVIASIALLAAILFWPQIFSETSLHDHGLTTRTWFARRKRCLYDDIKQIREDDNGLTFYLASGGTLHHPARLGDLYVVGREIEDLRGRSLACRYAQSVGLPFRLPETRLSSTAKAL